MKRFEALFVLNTKQGRISVAAPNRVDAFDKMHFLFPDTTEGYYFRDVIQLHG